MPAKANKHKSDDSDWSKSSYPLEELEWLEKDFKSLDALRDGLCESIMRFVVTGTDDGILLKLAALRPASGGMGLRGRDIPERDRFFSSTSILDPAFHLRLALIYDAATQYQRTAGTVPAGEVTFGLRGVADFIDAYLFEAFRVKWSSPGRTKPSQISVTEIEAMLELHGAPRSALVRGALAIDPEGSYYSSGASSFIPQIQGFAESLVRHLETVRSCLEQPDHRCKTHVLAVLLKTKFSPAHCADLAAQLAVHSAKGVRTAAETWIELDPASVLPHLWRLAAEAGPAERFQAVKLLSRIGGAETPTLLAERLEKETSPKVVELIEGILNPQSQVDLAAEGASAVLPELPDLPDLLADQALNESVLEDLRKLVDDTNAEWRAEWEKSKTQSWSPKEPYCLPEVTAEEWFRQLQTLGSDYKPRKERMAFSPGLTAFAAHPAFKLVHVIRWAAILNPENFFDKSRAWFGLAIQCFDARVQRHGPVPYREVAAICQQLGLESDWIAKLWFSNDNYRGGGEFFSQTGDEVWPYFSERIPLLEKALGWIPCADGFVPSYSEATYRTNAWRALAEFPVPPPSLIDRMWEVALGSSKTERPLAQEALRRAPNRDARLIAALSSGQQEQRVAAAGWIGRLKPQSAIPALRAAIAKEKSDSAKAVMIGALELLGVPPDEFLDRAALLKEARKITVKGLPAGLEWFPVAQLPTVHWADSGATVEPEILHAWLIQAFKLKQAEPNALVRRYAAGFRKEEREALGQFILDAWIAQDMTPQSEEAEKTAMAEAQNLYQMSQAHPKLYASTAGKTLEEIYAMLLPRFLQMPSGSAHPSKGVLAVAGACAGAGAAPVVGGYLKKWYGTRVHQARALLQMLAWVDHPLATQTLLSIGTRFRTKSLQQEASNLAHAIAERKGWSLAELADRTIPSAGLDEEGVLSLDFGPRQFTAKLGEDLTLRLFDPEDKAIKALPDPRKDDDAEKAAAAKKQLAAARKELKQVLELQRVNFYEAMCLQRTWRFEDWDLYLARHPIVRHYCQRLIWTARRGEEAFHFRPLADGSLTDVEDNPVELTAEDMISLTHRTTVTAETASAWLQHLSDYEITTLFDQLGREAPELTAETRNLREMKDFEGWMSDTFKIRGRANKLGYVRGETGDGGWFYDYVKRFPTTGLVAMIEFTGSHAAESQMPAALTKLTFHRANGGHRSQGIPLNEVPAVLLAECWNDYRQLAADGSGFDSEWSTKASR